MTERRKRQPKIKEVESNQAPEEVLPVNEVEDQRSPESNELAPQSETVIAADSDGKEENSDQQPILIDLLKDLSPDEKKIAKLVKPEFKQPAEILNGSQIIGIKMFETEEEFIAWQKEEQREIFDITPLIAAVPTAMNSVHVRIFVTYAVK